MVATENRSMKNFFKEEDSQYGYALDSVCTMLSLVPPEPIREAISNINHLETVGPLLDPTAWMGKRFDNSREWKKLLHHLAEAAAIIQRKEEHSD